jgi:hypothetical protein
MPAATTAAATTTTTTVASVCRPEHAFTLSMRYTAGKRRPRLCYSDRLRILEKREEAWATLDFRKPVQVCVPFDSTGIYDFTGGAFLLGTRLYSASRCSENPAPAPPLPRWGWECVCCKHAKPIESLSPEAGMEFGDECCMCFTAVERLRRRLRKHRSLGCGDVADITNNGGTTAAETDCAMPCTGDPLHLCGGPNRLQLYLWNGNLNNWKTPANIGRYEVRTKPLICIYARACYN